MKKGILKLEIVLIQKGHYIVNYKEGQKEFIKRLAEIDRMTLDELIVKKIEEMTGGKIWASPFYISMAKK